MESLRSWIQDISTKEWMQNVVTKAGLGDTKTQIDLKVTLYVMGVFFAVVYLTQSIRIRRATGKPWLKLRSRSPDPEKSDARKSAEKQTKAMRPLGSKFEKIVTSLWLSDL